MNFNGELATAVKAFSDSLHNSPDKKKEFEQNPTAAIKNLLREKGISVEAPELFHAHAIKVGHALPQEPQQATRDRYIYIFRKSGLFEFKVVPGTPNGDDSIMNGTKGACACCNCCVLEV